MTYNVSMGTLNPTIPVIVLSLIMTSVYMWPVEAWEPWFCVTINPVCFLVGCHKRRLNQALFGLV